MPRDRSGPLLSLEDMQAASSFADGDPYNVHLPQGSIISRAPLKC